MEDIPGKFKLQVYSNTVLFFNPEFRCLSINIPCAQYASLQAPGINLQSCNFSSCGGRGKCNLLSFSSQNTLSREIVEGTWHDWRKHLEILYRERSSFPGRPEIPAVFPAVTLTVCKKCRPNKFWATSPFLQKYSQMLAMWHGYTQPSSSLLQLHRRTWAQTCKCGFVTPKCISWL